MDKMSTFALHVYAIAAIYALLRIAVAVSDLSRQLERWGWREALSKRHGKGELTITEL